MRQLKTQWEAYVKQQNCHKFRTDNSSVSIPILQLGMILSVVLEIGIRIASIMRIVDSQCSTINGNTGT